VNASNRFIDGEDRLSDVLKTLPFFDAPETLKSTVLHAAQEREKQYRHQPAAPIFTPSEALKNAVLQEARAIERAQSGRREAVLKEIAQRKSVKDVLGAPVSAETESWLKQKTNITFPAKPVIHKSSFFTRRRLGFALTFSLAILSGVMLHYFYSPHFEENFEVSYSPSQTMQGKPRSVMEDETRARQHSVLAEPASSDLESSRQQENTELNHELLITTPPAIVAREKRYNDQAPQTVAPLPMAPLSSAVSSSVPIMESSSIVSPEMRNNADLAAAEASSPASVASSPAEIVEQRIVNDIDIVASECADTSAFNAKPSSPSRMAPATAIVPRQPAVIIPLDGQENARVEAGRDIRSEFDITFTYPVDWFQWKQLAQGFAQSPQGDEPHQWQLKARAPDDDDVQRLADILRAELPSGATLKVIADDALPDHYVRLELLNRAKTIPETRR
jgi:hypothetical protein